MFDVLPKHGHGPQVFLRTDLCNRTSTRGGIEAEETLKNAELGFIFTQQADVLTRPGRADGRHADLLAWLQLDLHQCRQRNPNRIVGAACGCGCQNVAAALVLCMRRDARQSNCRRECGCFDVFHVVLPMYALIGRW